MTQKPGSNVGREGGIYREIGPRGGAKDNFATVPENRVYLSPIKASMFIREFVAFSRGRIVSDDSKAPGIEIGRPNDAYRRVRIESGFGKMTVIVSSASNGGVSRTVASAANRVAPGCSSSDATQRSIPRGARKPSSR